LVVYRAGGGISLHAKYPPLNQGDSIFTRRYGWLKEVVKTAIQIRLAQPGGGRIGILLIGCAAVAGVVLAPAGRIDLRQGRLTGGNLPAVEGPEVDPFLQPPTGFA
jgi:hypothetical protein